MIKFAEIEKDTTWYSWLNRRLTRFDTLTGDEIIIEPGVAYFIDALEQLRADVQFSCEGHPKGFYVCFAAPFDLALRVANAGYMTVELCRDGRWKISLSGNERGIETNGAKFTVDDRNDILKSAAAVWERGIFKREASLLQLCRSNSIIDEAIEDVPF